LMPTPLTLQVNESDLAWRSVSDVVVVEVLSGVLPAFRVEEATPANSAIELARREGSRDGSQCGTKIMCQVAPSTSQ